MKNSPILLVILAQACSSVSFAQVSKNPQVPNAELSVAAKEEENGKIGKSVYLFTLKCHQGNCELITLRIRCENYSLTARDSSFRPEIWRSSTSDGTLAVRNLGNQLEVQETANDIIGGTKGSYIFGYSLNNSTQFAAKVTSFSGGEVMTIRYLKEVHTVQFVPLIGSDVWVRLDCNMLWLPGVDTTK